jgi:hypothetical protein
MCRKFKPPLTGHLCLEQNPLNSADRREFAGSARKLARGVLNRSTNMQNRHSGELEAGQHQRCHEDTDRLAPLIQGPR